MLTVVCCGCWMGMISMGDVVAMATRCGGYANERWARHCVSWQQRRFFQLWASHFFSLGAALMRPHHPLGCSPHENLAQVYWAGGANVSHFEHLFTLTAVHPQWTLMLLVVSVTAGSCWGRVWILLSLPILPSTMHTLPKLASENPCVQWCVTWHCWKMWRPRV